MTNTDEPSGVPVVGLWSASENTVDGDSVHSVQGRLTVTTNQSGTILLTGHLTDPQAPGPAQEFTFSVVPDIPNKRGQPTFAGFGAVGTYENGPLHPQVTEAGLQGSVGTDQVHLLVHDYERDQYFRLDLAPPDANGVAAFTNEIEPLTASPVWSTE